MIPTSVETENGDNRRHRKWEREKSVKNRMENGIASPITMSDDDPRPGKFSMASGKETDSESRALVARGLTDSISECGNLPWTHDVHDVYRLTSRDGCDQHQNQRQGCGGTICYGQQFA